MRDVGSLGPWAGQQVDCEDTTLFCHLLLLADCAELHELCRNCFPCHHQSPFRTWKCYFPMDSCIVSLCMHPVITHKPIWNLLMYFFKSTQCKMITYKFFLIFLQNYNHSPCHGKFKLFSFKDQCTRSAYTL